MILDLDDARARDPSVAGAKGAGLARARQAGLPVLPGFVVTTDAGCRALAHGAAVLPRRGSGGARSAVLGAPLADGLERGLDAALTTIDAPLVVRSSSTLEGDGRWAGALTSYLKVDRSEVAAAVRGCWASAFSVAALARTAADGRSPADTSMAVVIQPWVDLRAGGSARLDGDEIIVIGVLGSPGPLLQGWEPGAVARVRADGSLRGDRAREMLGASTISLVASTIRSASERVGYEACEWGQRQNGGVLLLQVSETPATTPSAREVPEAFALPGAAVLARVLRRAPGPLGEHLILPWAIGEPPEGASRPIAPAGVEPRRALAQAQTLAEELTRAVWRGTGLHPPDVLRRVLGTDPASALAVMQGLATPDPEAAAAVRTLVDGVRVGLVEAGEVAHVETAWYVDPSRAAEVLAGAGAVGLGRVGVDRWEPFAAMVALRTGRPAFGTGAAPNLGYGRLCFVADPGDAADFRPRDVIVTTYPVPGFGALLWDAAGIVTMGGSPAAHLFESARALGIPAVCGVHPEELAGEPLATATGRYAVAVDGDSGAVVTVDW